MRAELIDYIGTLNLGTIILSQESPWDESGSPLYLKNLRRVYVDWDETVSEPVITTFSGLYLSNETTTVRAYFAVDAKQIPANYEDVVRQLRLAQNITTVEGIHRRDCTVATSYVNDILVTELVYAFTKLYKE